MSGSTVNTVLTYVGAFTVSAVFVALIYYGAVLAATLWGRWAPPHWWLDGPGRAQPADRLYRRLNASGGHAHSVRRLLRVGPWGVHLVRYRPGWVDDPAPEPEKIP